MTRRVVVTGFGMVTPLGHSVETSWKNALAGNSGVALIDFFDTTDCSSKISGSVRQFNPENYGISEKEARRCDLFIQFALAAAKEAVEDSGLMITEENAPRVGTAIGAGMCGLPILEKSHSTMMQMGIRRLSPFFIPAIIGNMAGGNVSIRFNCKGPSCSIVSACATGTHNIGVAARMIAYGDADVMLAGGAEMATSALGVGGFCAMRALSTRNDEPQKASRPWDKDRDGFVIGDGAGVMVLEELEQAKKRGAKIYAELVGFGMSADANHITAPDPEGDGAARCMQNAINDAKINATAIDYINAHGTSTPLGDEIEVKAIKKVFGDHAYQLAVSSSKSMTGHLLGATGAVEAIFSVLTLRDQVVSPTINLDHPSEGCDLNFVPHMAQERKVDVVLSNSFGFGGTNATLIFKRFE